MRRVLPTNNMYRPVYEKHYPWSWRKSRRSTEKCSEHQQRRQHLIDWLMKTLFCCTSCSNSSPGPQLSMICSLLPILNLVCARTMLSHCSFSTVFHVSLWKRALRVKHARAWFCSCTILAPFSIVFHFAVFHFTSEHVVRSVHLPSIKDQSGYLTDQLWDLKSSTPKVLKQARHCESVLRASFPFRSSAGKVQA